MTIIVIFLAIFVVLSWILVIAMCTLSSRISRYEERRLAMEEIVSA